MNYLDNIEYIEKNINDKPFIVGGFQINNLLLLSNNNGKTKGLYGGNNTHYQLFDRLKGFGIPAGLFVSKNTHNNKNNFAIIKHDYNNDINKLFDDFTTLVGIKQPHNKTKSNKKHYKNIKTKKNI